MNVLFALMVGVLSLATPHDEIEDGTTVGEILNLAPVNATNAAEEAVRSYDATNLTPRIAAKYTKPNGGIPMTDIAPSMQSLIYGKQDALVSGVNIKTINNQSIVGTGNLHIEGGSGMSSNQVVSIADDRIDKNVPAWAREPNPPEAGVTDVKVDGTSVVSGGVADVVVSNKQETLFVERTVRLDHFVSRVEIVGSGYMEKTAESASVEWDGVNSRWKVTIFMVDSSSYVVRGNSVYRWNGSEWVSGGYSRDDDSLRVTIRSSYSPGGDSFEYLYCSKVGTVRNGVESSVDEFPSSASTNRLVTSKGVADAIASIPRGTDTNAVRDIASSAAVTNVGAVAAAQAMTNGLIGTINKSLSLKRDKLDDYVYNVGFDFSKFKEIDPTLEYSYGSTETPGFIIGRNNTHQITLIGPAYISVPVGPVDTKSLIMTEAYDPRFASLVGVQNPKNYPEKTSVKYAKESNTLSGYGIADAYTKTEVNTISNGAVTAANAYADGKFLSMDCAAGASIAWGEENLYFSGGGVGDIVGTTWTIYDTTGYADFRGYKRDGTDIDDIYLGKNAQAADSNKLNGHTEAQVVAGLITAPTATNAAEAVFSAYADYALTNLTGAAVELASGQIGNVTLGAGTNALALTLNFSAAADRSGDCLLYLVNPTDTHLSIEPSAAVKPVGIDLTQAVKAGTNLVMATRLKREGNKSVVLISTKEVK